MRRLLFALLIAGPLTAQTPAQDSVKVLRKDLDSLNRELAKIDSLKGRFQRAYQAAYHPTRWYAGALASGVAVNAVFHLDVDHGGYGASSWTGSDKIGHFVSASFLVDHADRMRVPLRYAVPITCGAAWAFEVSQGHVDPKDAVVSCAGASVAGILRVIERKANKNQRSR